jgi:colanic acid/amylovoran biosynthesis protein
MIIKNILVRAYTQLNLGDDLFLKVLFERFNNTHFILLAPFGKYKKWEKQYDNVIIINFHFTLFDRLALRIISHLKSENYMNVFVRWKYRVLHPIKEQINAYLYIGGSLFQQHNEGCCSMNEIIDTYLTDLFSDKPKYILGANFGPFREEKYVFYYRTIFKQYTDVCFRDIYSYNLFKDIPNVRYEKDIIFCLDKLENIETEINSVGFSLIGLHYFPDICQYEQMYITTIVQLIIKLLSKNKSVYMFSFCKYGGDEKIIGKVIRKLSSQDRDKIKFIKYRGSINSFLSEYLKMESMFTTRFHSMILSVVANQYIYPLVYSKKMINVMNDLGYNIKYSNINNLDGIENIIKDLYSNKLCFSISDIGKSAESQFIKISQFVNDEVNA